MLFGYCSKLSLFNADYSDAFTHAEEGLMNSNNTVYLGHIINSVKNSKRLSKIIRFVSTQPNLSSHFSIVK